jgi:peptide subunit release factor 1 (eRF1)
MARPKEFRLIINNNKYVIVNQYSLDKRRLHKKLSEIKSGRRCYSTIYIPQKETDLIMEDCTRAISMLIGKSETGIALFLEEGSATCIVPPFPIKRFVRFEGTNIEPLTSLLNQDLIIGIILLRLGRCAVGILNGESLVARKTLTRYVKSRHKAGGSSQRRFERSRERLIREFFDKSCEAISSIMNPVRKDMHYLLFGGEQNIIKRFSKRCTFVNTMTDVTLRRIVQVEKPGTKSINEISTEVWKSQIYTVRTT